MASRDNMSHQIFPSLVASPPFNLWSLFRNLLTLFLSKLMGQANGWLINSQAQRISDMQFDPVQERGYTCVNTRLFGVTTSFRTKTRDSSQNCDLTSTTVMSARHEWSSWIINTSVTVCGSSAHLIRSDKVVGPRLLAPLLIYLRQCDFM